MPTDLRAARHRPDPTESFPPGSGAPLVLTRIPWLGSELATVVPEIAKAALPAPQVTHFEFLTGELRLDCELAGTTTEYVRTQAAEPPSTERPPHSLTKTSSEPTSKPVPNEGRDVDWSEMILRLDAAVAPYTRAIVLLVVVVVIAFAVLLLASDDHSPSRTEASSAPSRLNPSRLEARQEPGKRSRRLPKPIAAQAHAEAAMPTARGPASFRIVDSPPVATLSDKIQPAPPEAIAKETGYPSVALPTRSTSELLPSNRSDEAAQEARQRELTPPTTSFK